MFKKYKQLKLIPEIFCRKTFTVLKMTKKYVKVEPELSEELKPYFILNFL